MIVQLIGNQEYERKCGPDSKIYTFETIIQNAQNLSWELVRYQ